MPTRRDFVRASAATAGTVATAGVATAERDPYGPKPEYVTLAYDETTLETYRPYLVTRHLDIQPTRLYAWTATSTERDTTMHCYWAYYPTQQGLTSADSHRYDREPVYVEVADDTGDVEAVHVDGYHYLLGTYPAPELVGDTHPTLFVQSPHHFYTETAEVGDDGITLADMADQYEPWIDNGWGVDRESVVNPWTVKPRGHWWRDGTFGVSGSALYWETALDVSQTVPGLDIGGASEADL